MTTPNIDTPTTPEQCERIHIVLRGHPEGSTAGNIAYWSSIDIRIVVRALHEMESRGAVERIGARWFASPKD